MASSRVRAGDTSDGIVTSRLSTILLIRVADADWLEARRFSRDCACWANKCRWFQRAPVRSSTDNSRSDSCKGREIPGTDRASGLSPFVCQHLGNSHN